jgi:hypothetical protein
MPSALALWLAVTRMCVVLTAQDLCIYQRDRRSLSPMAQAGRPWEAVNKQRAWHGLSGLPGFT